MRFRRRRPNPTPDPWPEPKPTDADPARAVSGFDHEAYVLRDTPDSPVCDRCAAPAIACADLSTGPLLLCLDHFSPHAVRLVELAVPLTLLKGLY